MAKSSRTSRPGGRDHSPIASHRLPRWTSTPVNLQLFQDRRTWHPEGPYRPLFSSPRISRAIVGSPPSRTRSGRMRFSHPGLSFAQPDKVILCVRRKTRKEVMFAKNKAGKRGQKKPKRNYWSNITC